ncbi:MAG: tyrosine--tRNA ligase, partial [Sphingomicrobium sp.]
PGMTIASALMALGFTASNGEAKRKIAEGAVRLGDVVVSDAAMVVEVSGEPVRISLGKKKHGLISR